MKNADSKESGDASGENPGEKPRGELFIQAAAMPADTNPNGDIFGGWLLSQMDIAGGIAARSHSGGRTVTIAVESMIFKQLFQKFSRKNGVSPVLLTTIIKTTRLMKLRRNYGLMNISRILFICRKPLGLS